MLEASAGETPGDEEEFLELHFPISMHRATDATSYAIRNTQFAILILAYGNPLRRDDGVGWVIGERLAALLPEDAADVRVLHQLTPEWAEPISRAGAVLFIDAAEKTCQESENLAGMTPSFGATPGGIHWTEIQPSDFSAQPFTHQVDPASLLAAAQELYGHAPPTHLLTVTGADFGFGEGLSPQVAGVVEEAIGQIQQWMERRALETGE